MPIGGPFGSPIAGTDGRVQVGSTSAGIIRADKWSVNVTGNEIDTFNFESVSTGVDDNLTAPWGEGIVGKIEAEWSFEGYWDNGLSNGMHAAGQANPPHIRQGVYTDFLYIYVSKSLNPNRAFLFRGYRVYTVGVTNDANGRVAFTASGKSNGPFNYPGPPSPT